MSFHLLLTDHNLNKRQRCLSALKAIRSVLSMSTSSKAPDANAFAGVREGERLCRPNAVCRKCRL